MPVPKPELLMKKAWLALGSAILAFAFSYYLTVFGIAGGSIQIYADMNGFWYTALTLGMSAIISMLFGVWVAIFSLKAHRSISGFFGALVGAAATGCPTCGAPILALIGLPLGLFHLPFWGLELKAISIILISTAILSMTRENNGCKL